MKKATNKLMSFLAAFAMVIGVLVAPFTSANAADVVESGKDPVTAADHKTDVVIHKMELKDLKNWPKKAGVESNGHTYDGTELNAEYFGSDAEELDDVVFYYYTVADKANYDKLKENPSKYMTKKAMDDAIDSQDPDEKIEATYVEKVTTKDGNGATVSGLDNGYYWFVEDQDSVSRDGRTFSAAAAVPFGLRLPYANKDGKAFGTDEGNKLHVYPKNTLAGKPVVDKDFKKIGTNPTSPRSAEDKNKPESHDAGDIIEYEIKTDFQANTKYKTAFWTDQMTEGLTFNQDSLKVSVGDADLTLDTDYTVDTTTNTFKVTLTENGLKKVNNQPDKVTVTVSYTATLNDKAVVDIPESNDVVFHYGNNPSQGNTPVPNKPNEGKITFTKSWDGEVPEGASITVTLYNANTGAKVGESKNLTATELTAEWTGLDNDTEYKVVETGIDNWDAEYTAGEAGILGATNHKTNNPKPLNPDEPKVVIHGKKFVKMEEGSDTVRLQGAKFVIKNAEGKFLGSTASQATEEKGKFDTAQEAYVAALNEYNTEVAKPNPTNLDTLKSTLTEKKKARDDAFTAYVEAQNKWIDGEGEDKTGVPEGALELTSDEEGRFKVEGLAAGTYKLVETEKPKGYAARTDEIEFTVGDGTYAGDSETEIQYNKDDTNDGYGLRVDNKKVTIPETGGIGSLIFIVAGLALMGVAFVAMKRRNSYEEA